MSKLVLVCIDWVPNKIQYRAVEYAEVASLCNDDTPFINQINLVDLMKDNGTFSYNCYKDIIIKRKKGDGVLEK